MTNVSPTLSVVRCETLEAIKAFDRVTIKRMPKLGSLVLAWWVRFSKQTIKAKRSEIKLVLLALQKKCSLITISTELGTSHHSGMESDASLEVQ